MSKRYTIAVDFDGVIHSYTSPWVDPHVIPDPPTEGALDWLKAMCVSFDVVIFSTRCRTWRGRRAIRRWLWTWDTGGPCQELARYPFAAWEDTCVLGQVSLKHKKPPALIYLDDRAMRFEGPGTFPTKSEIHRAIPWHKREVMP